MGDRHRAQAEKFLRNSEKDENKRIQCLNWAEQSSRQSVLYDFTNDENWRLLIQIKVLIGDKPGIHAVIEDLFLILGRDPERLRTLQEVDLLDHGVDLVNAAFEVDPLDPELWYHNVASDEGRFEEFSERIKRLDLRDPRTNIVFGRRIERLYTAGRHDEFIPLARRIVAQRPQNHEAWIGLGRLHERREEYDEAWLCYDQAQTHFPSRPVRDEYRERMDARLDGERKSWKIPDISTREIFLTRMESLATPESSNQIALEIEDDDTEVSEVGESEQDRLKRMLDEGEIQAALFLARRLVTSGEEWAQAYYDSAMEQLQ
ncbi:MAG TPA: tetratricopeptide repeat protein [Candidatus Thalassarchaeaceae archaeon]|nr:tetratricopeptide repeat protein [Candidatus Thalassarchaeaceae archaeon]